MVLLMNSPIKTIPMKLEIAKRKNRRITNIEPYETVMYLSKRGGDYTR